tara:strand:+ start:30822 stop:31256 length:435 start_codon:yes stop_codon:yes gene_type:complete
MKNEAKGSSTQNRVGFNPKVRVSNIYAEDLFQWFYQHVGDSGGDGASVICCGNHKEVAEEFLDWWKKNHLPELKKRGRKSDEFFHPRHEYGEMGGGEIVNFHDWNENYMFCNHEISLYHGDYSFVIEGDCKSAFSEFVIKKVTE